MSKVVPLIRAAAICPMISWMVANGRPVLDRLRAADLSYVIMLDPNEAIPVLNGIEFLRGLARHEGPDIGCRMVSRASWAELAMLGKVALGAETPRDALKRVSMALPNHCTHEHITITNAKSDALVQEFWTLPIDDEALHLIQQYVAAVLGALCQMADARAPSFTRVEMVPHPEAGLQHLRRWFGTALVPARSRTLSLVIPKSIADQRFGSITRERVDLSVAEWSALRGDGRLAASVCELLRAMLRDGQPSVERVSAAAGLSVRTLQRRLAGEGTSVSELLESVRREAVLGALTDRGHTLTELSETLGYAHQSTLTRAVRRWTGKTPSLLRTVPAGKQV